MMDDDDDPFGYLLPDSPAERAEDLLLLAIFFGGVGGFLWFAATVATALQ